MQMIRCRYGFHEVILCSSHYLADSKGLAVDPSRGQSPWEKIAVRGPDDARRVLERFRDRPYDLRQMLPGHDVLRVNMLTDEELMLCVERLVANGRLVLAQRPLSMGASATSSRASPAAVPDGARESRYATGRSAAEVMQRAPSAGPTRAPPVLEQVCVRVVGEDGKGLGRIAVQVNRSARQSLLRHTDESGLCRFTALEPGTYSLGLPDCDAGAWEVSGTGKLAQIDTSGTPESGWAYVPAADTREIAHAVVQGECGSKIGLRYGFFPQTIWSYFKNAGLRAIRPSLYILSSGDTLVIPPKRLKIVQIASQTEITLRRLGIPERLKIRFHDNKSRPRGLEAFAGRLHEGSDCQAQYLSKVVGVPTGF